MTVKEILPNVKRAHELYGNFWFNSEPVPIAAMRGNVVLIHFWDYTCIPSQRGLPYVQEWHRKYRENGLTVVGVHTPRFPFARDPQLVQRMIEKFRIVHPVVTDNEHFIASRYQNISCPATILVDKHGFIRHENMGVGNYAVTERMIQILLYDAGVGEELPELMSPLREEDKPGAVCYRVTPEVFAGYAKGSLGNVEGFQPGSVVQYTDPGIYVEGRMYASGSWLNERNALTFSSPGGGNGQVVLPYVAREVNVVLSPEAGRELELEIMQDDEFLVGENFGTDVNIEDDGRSILQVKEPGVFNIVRNRACGQHVLKISSCKAFSLYSFMFGSSIIQEPISRN